MPSYRTATHADLNPCWEVRTRALRTGCIGHYPAATIELLCASAAPDSMPRLFDAGGALVAEEDGRIVGYAVLDGHSGEVDAVFVEPEQGGRGIATALMRRLEALAARRGLNRLFLSASLNAVAFYERAGFASVREELYPHRSGIAIGSVFMEKHLIPGQADQTKVNVASCGRRDFGNPLLKSAGDE